MHISTVLGGLSVLSGATLAYASSEVESSNFNVTAALADLGIDVSTIPALESLSGAQARSTDKACAAAVRAIREKKKAIKKVSFSNPTFLVLELELYLWLEGFRSKQRWVQ